MSISWCTLLTLYAVIGENCERTRKAGLHRKFSCPQIIIAVTWMNCLKLCQELSLKQATETQNTQVNITLTYVMRFK